MFSLDEMLSQSLLQSNRVGIVFYIEVDIKHGKSGCLWETYRIKGLRWPLQYRLKSHHCCVTTILTTSSKNRIQQDFGDRIQVGEWQWFFLSLLPSNRSLDHPWHRKGKGWFQEGHHLGLSGPHPQSRTPVLQRTSVVFFLEDVIRASYFWQKCLHSLWASVLFFSRESHAFLNWLCVCS